MTWKEGDLVITRHYREWYIDPDTGELIENSPFETEERKRAGYNSKSPYPGPVPLLSKPAGGGNSKRIPERWWNVTRSMNPPLIWRNPAIRADGTLVPSMCKLNYGWANGKPNAKDYPGQTQVLLDDPPYVWPYVEAITSIYNIHRVIERRNGATRVAAYRFSDPVPDVIDPYMVCTFRSIALDGTIADMGSKFLLLVIDEAWIPDEQLELHTGEEPPQEPIMVNRAWGVDISKWQYDYKDDNLDEGFPLDFVIQKCADGAYDYTIPENTTWWVDQYESIKHFTAKGGYQWFYSHLDPIDQAEVLVKISNDVLYEFFAVDFEGEDVATFEAAMRLVEYCEYFWANAPGVKLMLYTNGWIYTLLRSWLGDWLDKLPLWFAGGKYYNVALDAPLDDSVVPNVPDGFTFWQVSADGNQLADELDFGDNETSSIDLDVFNGTYEDLLVWMGSVIPPEDPPVEPPPVENDATIALMSVEIAEHSDRMNSLIGDIE